MIIKFINIRSSCKHIASWWLPKIWSICPKKTSIISTNMNKLQKITQATIYKHKVLACHTIIEKWALLWMNIHKNPLISRTNKAFLHTSTQHCINSSCMHDQLRALLVVNLKAVWFLITTCKNKVTLSQVNYLQVIFHQMLTIGTVTWQMLLTLSMKQALLELVTTISKTIIFLNSSYKRAALPQSASSNTLNTKKSMMILTAAIQVYHLL